MVWDGSIRINTRLDGKGFDEGLNGISRSLRGIASVIGVTFGVAAIVNFSKSSVQAAARTESAWAGLGFVLEANNRSIVQARKFLEEYTVDGLVPLTSAVAAYQNLVQRGYETDQIEQMLNFMKDAASFARQGQFSMGEAIEKTTQGLRMENSLLTDSVGIQTNVAKMWAQYAAEIGTTANNLTLAQKRQAEFNGFMREGGVFAGAAQQYLNTYSGRIAQLSAMFINLRVAVGNATIPVINALLPTIINMMTWMTRLFNIAGRVMNLLFGTNVGTRELEAQAQATQETADAQGELVDNTERADKAAQKALASFDRFNVLAQGGEGGSAVIMPILEPPETPGQAESAFTVQLDELERKVEKFKQELADLFRPAQISFANLLIALEPLKSFSATGLENFYQRFLLPVATWTITDALPQFLATTAVAVEKVDWEGLLDSLDNLWIALAPFAENVGTGLLWFYENVVVPIGLWVINEALPAFLDLLAAAVGALDKVLEGAAPAIKDFWNIVMLPILSFVGRAVILIIEDLTAAFTAFGIWAAQNKETVKTMTDIILIFLAELWLYSTYKKIAVWVTATLIPALANFGATLAALNIPLILAGIGIAVLGAGIIAISKVWDKLTPAERTITLLGALASAAIAAAIAIAVFHTSWSVGIAAAAIVGGLALLASASHFSASAMPDLLNSGSGSFSSFNSLQGLDYTSSPLPGLATGAVIPPNAPFAAVLGDHKSQSEILAPEGTLRRLFREEMDAMGLGGDVLANITLQMDSATIYQGQQRVAKQRGRSLLGGLT